MTSPIGRKKESAILSDDLVELYLHLKGRVVTGGKSSNDDKEKLLSLGDSVLIGYVRSFVEMILSQLDQAVEQINMN
jgi:hypothetical protein